MPYMRIGAGIPEKDVDMSYMPQGLTGGNYNGIGKPLFRSLPAMPSMQKNKKNSESGLYKFSINFTGFKNN